MAIDKKEHKHKYEEDPMDFVIYCKICGFTREELEDL